MSSTLWSELDIATLQKGAEEFERLAKKFPNDLKKLVTFTKVQTVSPTRISYVDNMSMSFVLSNLSSDTDTAIVSMVFHSNFNRWKRNY
jgi:hypothetical protein